MPQKTARKKLLITRNGPPPDVGPPLRPRCVWGPNHPDAANGHHFGTQGGPHSPPESPRTPGMLLGSIQGLWWPSSSSATIRIAPARRRSHGDACSCVHLAAPRCPRRPPAWPGHRSRRQNTQQRKTGTYTALPVATRWPPCPRRHSVEPPLRRRARPCCRHISDT